VREAAAAAEEEIAVGVNEMPLLTALIYRRA